MRSFVRGVSKRKQLTGHPVVALGQTSRATAMPHGTCLVALVTAVALPDNEAMHRLRRLLGADVLLALVVSIGVVMSAALDWGQGQAPESRIPGVAGFGPFLVGAVVCAGAAVVSLDARRGHYWRSLSLVGAAVAAGLADPTYATLLFAIPLIEVARRAAEPERTISIGLSFAFMGWVVITEDARGGSEFESMLVLAIVMTIVVMFGNALRRLDRARVTEARLARVDERNRLAGDIHDSLGHHLLASSIQLRNAQALMQADPDAASTSIDLASGAVAEALAETRFMVDGTRAAGTPFLLERSLPGLVERAATEQVNISLEVSGDHRALEPLAQITLYRFAQEALANVIRHAGASHATVKSLVADGTARVVVVDDGRGFDVSLAPERTGLANLRERLARIGGTVDVVSAVGSGTTVTAVLSVSP